MAIVFTSGATLAGTTRWWRRTTGRAARRPSARAVRRASGGQIRQWRRPARAVRLAAWRLGYWPTTGGHPLRRAGGCQDGSPSSVSTFVIASTLGGRLRPSTSTTRHRRWSSGCPTTGSPVEQLTIVGHDLRYVERDRPVDGVEGGGGRRGVGARSSPASGDAVVLGGRRCRLRRALRVGRVRGDRRAARLHVGLRSGGRPLRGGCGPVSGGRSALGGGSAPRPSRTARRPPLDSRARRAPHGR